MKEFLRKIIHPSLWDFIRYIKFKYFKFGYFAPYQLDKKLQKYLNYDYGFFVELGANDGHTESNTLFLENKRNWRGVLIEPSPQQFLSCCYYRSKPGNKLFCNACVPFNYKKEYVDIEYANLMSVSVSLKNDLKDISKEGKNSIVMVFAATNLVKDLDPALLRSGRFDKKVFFDLPNKEEREELFKLYITGVDQYKRDKNF